MQPIDLKTLYRLYRQYPKVITDSRKCEPNSIFFALKGDNFDGNQFAEQALAAGCNYAIVDHPQAVTDSRILFVDNVLLALQQLATHHRLIWNKPVIGITGTNGKTTTKELTAAILSRKYNVLYTEGNLNNHIGVPLTLLRLTDQHDIAVIEMGANHPGEIKALANIVLPDYGLITNVGKAHLEGFGSLDGVIKTKTELYEVLRQRNGSLFIHHENHYLQPHSYGLEKIEYGTADLLFVSGHLTKNTPLLAFEFKRNGESCRVQTQLVGSYNLDNALAATAISAYFGVPNVDIVAAFEEYTPQNRRSQLQVTKQNKLIIDAYNANPTSMIAAITNFDRIDVSPKALILGDMRELGVESLKEHAAIVALLKSLSFDRIWLVGHEFSQTADNFPVVADTATLIHELQQSPITGYYILVKGSRGMQLENCLPYL